MGFSVVHAVGHVQTRPAASAAKTQWAIPLGVIGLAIWRVRPPVWTWPILAALLVHPGLADAPLRESLDVHRRAGRTVKGTVR